MKNMKKIVALLVAVLMLVASVSAFAVEDNSNLGAPYDGDTNSDTTFVGVADNSISVGGLEPGDVVKFYRILDFDQDARGTLGTDLNAHGWKVVAPFLTGTGAVTATDLQAILTTGITSEMAGRIAKNATGEPTWDATVPVGGTVATKENPGPGLYVAIVVPANAGFVYNPIFVASDYYKTGDDSNSSTWTAVTTPLSYADRGMAKKSPVTITKTAEEADEDTNETDGAKAVGVDDVITYTITTTIPEFADNYTKPLFVISDKLSAGLTFGGNDTITVTPTLSGTDKLSAEDYDITNPEGLAFKITFKPASLLNLSAATPITITYTATVTETAITNVNEEDNTVTLEYSHEPSVDDEGEGKKVRDKTHHYTFTIDGVIWGDSSYKTTEVVKVGLDKDGNEITQTVEMHSGKKIGALAGAKFKLYTDSELKEEYKKGDFAPDGKTIVSDSEGRLTVEGTTNGIRGLDAGTYYLVETEAPAGYIKQQAATVITITPVFYPEIEWTDADGLKVKSDDLMKQYTVTIDDATTATYTIEYKDALVDGKPVNDLFKGDVENMVGTSKSDIVIGNSGPITTIPADNDPTDDDGKIKNTQGVELPSTGGMGTTLLYIGGSVLVILAAVLLITKRRMSAND